VKWAEKAANQGLPAAEFGLGVCFAFGKGVQEDPEHAREWMKKAAADIEYYKANKENIDSWLAKLSEPAQQAEPAEESANSQNASFKIKGFYIGMDIDAAKQNISEKIKDTTSDYLQCEDKNDNPMVIIADKSTIQNSEILISEMNATFNGAKFNAAREEAKTLDLPAEERVKFMVKTLSIDPAVITSYGEKTNVGISFVLSDEHHKVCSITFDSGLVNYLFKANDMDAPSFADEFMKAYKIPGWQAVPDWTVGSPQKYWSFTSPDGVKITISPNKSLMILKVPKKEEQQNAFN
jgi:hypothetical protein